MPRTGENIYKRKDGRWEGRYIKSYTSAGKALYGYVYSKTYSEVKVKLNLALADSIKHTKTLSKNYYFSEVAERWLVRIKADCKISTYNKYRNNMEKQITPFFGKYPISKISGEMIDNYIIFLLTNGRNDSQPFSHKTAQDICMEIKRILSFACENYGVKTQFPLKMLSIKQEKKETMVLDNLSVQNLCRNLLTDINLYKIGVLISLYTGVRIGELCAIQWKDISIDDGLLSISKTAQRVQQFDNQFQKTKLCIFEPKSACSNRIIPIPSTLLPIISPFKSDDKHYLLSGNDRCVDPRTMQYHFKKYLKESNIEETNFHVLRHTFATNCIEVGFDIKTLSEILGHSSVNITLDRYVHSSMKTKQESMNKLVVGM